MGITYLTHMSIAAVLVRIGDGCPYYTTVLKQIYNLLEIELKLN